jgi:hypothetical protein
MVHLRVGKPLGPVPGIRKTQRKVRVVEIVAKRRVESTKIQQNLAAQRPCWCRAASAPFPGQLAVRIVERDVAPLPVHRERSPLQRDAVPP